MTIKLNNNWKLRTMKNYYVFFCFILILSFTKGTTNVNKFFSSRLFLLIRLNKISKRPSYNTIITTYNEELNFYIDTYIFNIIPVFFQIYKYKLNVKKIDYIIGVCRSYCCFLIYVFSTVFMYTAVNIFVVLPWTHTRLYYKHKHDEYRFQI